MASAAACLDRGLTAHRQGDYAKAKAWYSNATRADPDCAQALIGLGVLAARSGATSEALGLYRKAIRISSGDGSASRDAGSASGRTRAEDSRSVARFNSGVVLQGKGKDRDALAHYRISARDASGRDEGMDSEGAERRWRQLAPRLTRAGRDIAYAAHVNMGLLLEKEGRRAQALTAFACATAISPEGQDARFALAAAQYRDGLCKDAAANFQRVVDADPAFVDARMGLATALCEMERLGDAASHFRQATQDAPEHAPAFNGLGFALLRAGDYVGAQKALAEAARLDHGFLSATLNLGLASANLGALDTAVALYDRVLRVHPRHEAALVAKGAATQLSKSGDAVLRFFEHAQAQAPEHVDTLVRLGVARQREGDVAGAQEVLGAAHEADPANPYVALALGACEHQAGHREEALRLYRHAERLQRKLPALAAHMGRLHLDMGAPRRALPHLRRAVAEEEGDAGSQVNLGLALLAAGDAGAAQEAEKAFAHALRADPRSPQAHLGAATVAHGAGGLGEAEEHYAATLAAQPRNPRALYGVGSVLHARGRVRDALSRYEAAVEEDPSLFEAWYNLGLVLESLDRVAESLRAFERALKLRPDSSDTQRSVDRLRAKGSGGRQAEEAYAQGVAAYARGEVDEAVSRLNNAHSLAPQDEVITYALGAALHAAGRPDAAQRHAATVARSGSPCAKYGQLLMGALLLERGSPAEALRHLRAAVETDPEMRDAWLELAIAHEQREDMDEAAECLAQAVRLDDDAADSHYALGALCHRRGHATEARQHYKDAIRVDPDFGTASLALGTLTLGEGDAEEAALRFRTALRLDADPRAAHYGLGHALRVAGRLEEAAAAFEAALRVDDSYVDAWIHLGLVRAATKETKAAAAAFKEALQRDPASKAAQAGLKRLSQGASPG